MTGRGTSASWQIRGEQLGEAIGETVRKDATDVRAGTFGLAIVVKRLSYDLLQRLHKARIPIVYDVVDAWPQPVGNVWDEATCKAWLAQHIAQIKPIAIVAATKAMAKDCEGFGVPVLALPHHARPNQAANPIRDQVRKVGYEGAAHYLGSWQKFMQDECDERGLEFSLNPESLSDVDIVVAIRHDSGYAPRHWKSNVKLANAQASGTPCIANRESGYWETKCGAECFADTHDEMIMALSTLASWESRKAAQMQMITQAPTLHAVAKEYKQWLQQLQ